MAICRPAIVAVSRVGWPAGQTARLIRSHAIEFPTGQRTPAYDTRVRCSARVAWWRDPPVESADATLETPAIAAITNREIRASVIVPRTTRRRSEVPWPRAQNAEPSVMLARSGLRPWLR